MDNGQKRVVIENVQPSVNCGEFPIKRAVGESVIVEADIIADSHDLLGADILYRKEGERVWQRRPMKLWNNDRWKATFIVSAIGKYLYTVKAWVDHFATWRDHLEKKIKAGQATDVDMKRGVVFIREAAMRASGNNMTYLSDMAFSIESQTELSRAYELAMNNSLARVMRLYPNEHFAFEFTPAMAVTVDREKANFSSWYELFPRSTAPDGKHGTFADCERLVPKIAAMGFNVLYLPPIHPIGEINRKGQNNATKAESNDPGSPWAIGSIRGGHKAVEPKLGTIDDFERLVEKAREHGLEIALDIAFQCAPDHPYVREHPEWFIVRADGTIQHAENPPKRYEDIVPFNFECESWKELWEELKSVITFWIEKGVRIFRVDNPHTKPFRFWDWLIAETKHDYPDVLFLAEAFTRPKIMYRLAKGGFSHSYTYFTWRNTKQELVGYMKELVKSPVADFFRPNFWPNTPDILPEYLQYGGENAFAIRLLLAATLSSNYGIYGPAFEQTIHQALSGKEEYLNSEKYEIKNWDWEKPHRIRDLITKINRIRAENDALHSTRTIRFYPIDNDYMLFYGKTTPDLSNVIIVVITIDPFHRQTGQVQVPLDELGIHPAQTYLMNDLLNGERFMWQGAENHVTIDPKRTPAYIFSVHRRLHRETDFDYY